MRDRMPRAEHETTSRRARLLRVGLPVLVFALFGSIVWFAYQEDARVPLGEPPLITAIAGPYKVAPDDPGGRQVADQGEINRLLRDGPEPARQERVLPLPEEPRRPVLPDPAEQPAQPRALAEVAPAAAGEGSRDQDAREEAETALAKLLGDVGPDAASSQGASAEETPADQSAASESDSLVVPAIQSRESDPTAPTSTGDPSPAAAPLERPSQEADEALTRLLAELTGEAVATDPAPQAAPRGGVAALAPEAPAARPASVGGSYRVQLAAISERDDAANAWDLLADRLGPLVAGYEPFYERAETANGVFTRIQLGPLASEDAAERLCVEIQQQNASCFVVSP